WAFIYCLLIQRLSSQNRVNRSWLTGLGSASMTNSCYSFNTNTDL
ncbi:unnamed protein product, partial [Brassica napus]